MSDIVKSEQKKEDWMNSKWRPMMGWMYMSVCICDFIIFPILWSVHQAVDKGQVNLQWQPLTLQGAGLFHMAMGAVLGIAAFGRTQEKIAGVNDAGFNAPPSIQPPVGNFGSSPTPGFGTTTPSASTGFGSTPTPATAVTAVTPLGNAHVPTGPQPEL
jgi:hypothetical protein